MTLQALGGNDVTSIVGGGEIIFVLNIKGFLQMIMQIAFYRFRWSESNPIVLLLFC